MNSNKTFFAFLAGIGVGAAIGILYAPDKGEITRDKLSGRLQDYRGQLQAFIEDLLNRGDEVAEQISGPAGDSAAKAEGQKVVSEARLKAEKLLKDVDNLMLQIKEKTA
jgi:gas vesicle protein